MSAKVLVDDWVSVFREAFEGGAPGKGTAFLDNTNADGGNNHGLLATLDGLSAAQASDPTPLGLSVAAHAAHLAYHMEVGVRWVKGERGPFDWKGSFEPRTVDEAGWAATRARVRAAYERTVEHATSTAEWTEDSASPLAAGLAHVCYHLGAIRQTIKLVR